LGTNRYCPYFISIRNRCAQISS